MSADALQLLVYVVAALVFSFLCSIAEAVLLSVTPSYIEGLKARRPRLAARLVELRIEGIDRSLSAILTLNTIAHTVGAIASGAKATVVFGDAWIGLFSAIVTLLILFVSEIIPKTVGALHWRRLVGFTVGFVRGIIVTLYPIVWLSECLTKSIARGRAPHVVSREEILAMARLGEAAGGIEGSEGRIIQNMLQADSLRVTDIMTPRTVIGAFPEDSTIAEAVKFVEQAPFSRIPVYRTGLDDITGYVLRADILQLAANGQGAELVIGLRREIHAVPEQIPLIRLLDELLRIRHHLALVVDEYGGTAGLVTIEDLVESFIGAEIVDETDGSADMRALARRKWLTRAERLGLDPDSADESGGHRPQPDRSV